ncbi:MAG: ketoacyl-ACP synthase III [Planctomycetales bacterium]|nr:ketoacyl-ACP synthase III [Planctomycetales bacterium]
MAITPDSFNSESNTMTDAKYSERSGLRTLRGVQVLGTGSYLPDQIVTNQDLASLGYDSDWILQRTGIQARRKLPDDLATSDMAIEAAQRCIEQSDVNPHLIDLIIVATMTPDSPVPSAACLVQDRLGLQAPAMDVNAACAGFMYALVTASQFVAAGGSQYALVVGADTNTRIVNPQDVKTYPLFGDGAGAVLLGKGNSTQGFASYTLGAEGDGASLLGIPAGGSRCPLTAESIVSGEQFIHMDGRSVFKWAVRLLCDTIQDVLLHAECTVDDVDLVILHQANARIIDAAADGLKIDRSKLVVNLDQYGNTSAGSIPICLDECHRSGNIRPGDKILLCGFGAGLAWGAALLEW